MGGTVHLISWSGGNDSTVMLHHLINGPLRDEDFRVVHFDTTITLPTSLEYMQNIIDLYDVRDRFDLRTPKMSFRGFLEKYRFWPTITRLWCRPVLKDEPMLAYYTELLKRYDRVIAYTGVGVYDSLMRSRKYLVDETTRVVGKGKKAVTITERYPVRLWDDAKKSRYSEEHRIPRNTAYHDLKVSGCYFCPFYHEDYYRKLRSCEPGLFKELCEMERESGSWINPDFSLSKLAATSTLDGSLPVSPAYKVPRNKVIKGKRKRTGPLDHLLTPP